MSLVGHFAQAATCSSKEPVMSIFSPWPISRSGRFTTAGWTSQYPAVANRRRVLHARCSVQAGKAQPTTHGAVTAMEQVPAPSQRAAQACDLPSPEDLWSSTVGPPTTTTTATTAATTTRIQLLLNSPPHPPRLIGLDESGDATTVPAAGTSSSVIVFRPRASDAAKQWRATTAGSVTGMQALARDTSPPRLHCSAQDWVAGPLLPPPVASGAAAATWSRGVDRGVLTSADDLQQRMPGEAPVRASCKVRRGDAGPAAGPPPGRALVGTAEARSSCAPAALQRGANRPQVAGTRCDADVRRLTARITAAPSLAALHALLLKHQAELNNHHVAASLARIVQLAGRTQDNSSAAQPPPAAAVEQRSAGHVAPDSRHVGAPFKRRRTGSPSVTAAATQPPKGSMSGPGADSRRPPAASSCAHHSGPSHAYVQPLASMPRSPDAPRQHHRPGHPASSSALQVSEALRVIEPQLVSNMSRYTAGEFAICLWSLAKLESRVQLPRTCHAPPPPGSPPHPPSAPHDRRGESAQSADSPATAQQHQPLHLNDAPSRRRAVAAPVGRPAGGPAAQRPTPPLQPPSSSPPPPPPPRRTRPPPRGPRLDSSTTHTPPPSLSANHDSSNMSANHDSSNMSANHDSSGMSANHDSSGMSADHDSSNMSAKHDSSITFEDHDSSITAENLDSAITELPPPPTNHSSHQAVVCQPPTPPHLNSFLPADSPLPPAVTQGFRQLPAADSLHQAPSSPALAESQSQYAHQPPASSPSEPPTPRLISRSSLLALHLARHLSRRPFIMKTATPRDLAMIFWAATQLHRRRVVGYRLLSSAVTAATRSARDFGPQAVSVTTWSLARLPQLPCRPLTTRLAVRATHIIRDFNLQALANTLWGLAALGRYHPQLMQAATAAAVDIISQLPLPPPPQRRSSSQVPAHTLVRQAPRHTHPHAHVTAPDPAAPRLSLSQLYSLTQLCWACAHLRHYAPTLMDWALAVAAGQASELSDAELALVMHAAAAVNHQHTARAAGFQVLVAEACRRARDPTAHYRPQSAATAAATAWALAVAALQCSPTPASGMSHHNSGDPATLRRLTDASASLAEAACRGTPSLRSLMQVYQVALVLDLHAHVGGGRAAARTSPPATPLLPPQLVARAAQTWSRRRRRPLAAELRRALQGLRTSLVESDVGVVLQPGARAAGELPVDAVLRCRGRVVPLLYQAPGNFAANAPAHELGSSAVYRAVVGRQYGAAPLLVPHHVWLSLPSRYAQEEWLVSQFRKMDLL